MNIYRGNTLVALAENTRLCLQPVTPLHIAILRQIESPVMIAARILAQGSERSIEEIAKLKELNFSDETRETVFVLTTPFAKLKRLQRMDRTTFRAAALAAVPEPKNEADLAAIQQLIGVHVGIAIFSIAKKSCQN